MKQYLDLLRYVKDTGIVKSNRTGIDRITIFGPQIEFDIEQGFPLMTTKKMFLRGIIYELLWFLRGDTNIKYLVQNNVHIWDEWAYKNYAVTAQSKPSLPKLSQAQFIDLIISDNDFAKKWGDLGPVYGAQWRFWEIPQAPRNRHWDSPKAETIDQISRVVERLVTKPNNTDHIVCAWNVGDLQDMALKPCHCLFQFFVRGNKLDCKLYQRSADMFLGVPFNIASYSMLTMMIAQVTDLVAGRLIHTFGDAHIYVNHLEQVRLQLNREPRPLPKMTLNPDIKSIFEFKFEDFTLTDYNPHPAIKAPIAV